MRSILEVSILDSFLNTFKCVIKKKTIASANLAIKVEHQKQFWGVFLMILLGGMKWLPLESFSPLSYGKAEWRPCEQVLLRGWNCRWTQSNPRRTHHKRHCVQWKQLHIPLRFQHAKFFYYPHTLLVRALSYTRTLISCIIMKHKLDMLLLNCWSFYSGNISLYS